LLGLTRAARLALDPRGELITPHVEKLLAGIALCRWDREKLEEIDARLTSRLAHALNVPVHELRAAIRPNAPLKFGELYRLERIAHGKSSARGWRAGSKSAPSARRQ